MARNRYAHHHLYHLYHVDSPSRNHLCPKLAPWDWNCIPQKMKKVHKTFFWKSRNLEVDTYEQDQVGRNGNWAVQRLLWWRSNRFLGSGFHLPLARPIPYHLLLHGFWKFLTIFLHRYRLRNGKGKSRPKWFRVFMGILKLLLWEDAKSHCLHLFDAWCMAWAKTKDPTR